MSRQYQCKKTKQICVAINEHSKGPKSTKLRGAISNVNTACSMLANILVSINLRQQGVLAPCDFTENLAYT